MNSIDKMKGILEGALADYTRWGKDKTLTEKGEGVKECLEKCLGHARRLSDGNMAEQALYAAALVKYGPSAQFIVALEELSELSKELAKCLRENPSDPGKAARRPQVAEEIADVRNMLAQVEYIMGLETVVEDIRVDKLRRLAGRISGI